MSIDECLSELRDNVKTHIKLFGEGMYEPNVWIVKLAQNIGRAAGAALEGFDDPTVRQDYEAALWLTAITGVEACFSLTQDGSDAAFDKLFRELKGLCRAHDELDGSPETCSPLGYVARLANMRGFSDRGMSFDVIAIAIRALEAENIKDARCSRSKDQ